MRIVSAAQLELVNTAATHQGVPGAWSHIVQRQPFSSRQQPAVTRGIFIAVRERHAHWRSSVENNETAYERFRG